MHKGIFHDLFVARQKVAVYREVAEWSKAHAWKVCIPQKGIEGSNPFLSAIFAETFLWNSTIFYEWCEFCGNENANLDLLKLKYLTKPKT